MTPLHWLSFACGLFAGVAGTCIVIGVLDLLTLRAARKELAKANEGVNQ